MAEAKTPKWQRVVIWIAAILMLVSTGAGLFFMVWATQDSSVDPNTIATEEYYQQQEEAYNEYLEQLEEERANMRGLEGYEDKVAEFDASSVTELTVEELKAGDGATISVGDSLKVNYTGWTPDGKIFDSTKSEGEDASPVTLSLDNLIDGWSNGLVGRNVGGIYLLTIPSDQAYGESGSGDGSIDANEPIKFMVEVISIES